MAQERGTHDLDAGLRSLAGEAGEAGKRGYPIVREGRRVRVEYVTDSDDEIQALSLVCRYDDVAAPHAPGSYRGESRGESRLQAVRPLDLRLEREREGHVRAKREGLVGEWQSGDPAFDERVFVKSPTTDPAVLAAVLGPEAREAAMALLGLGFETVQIDVEGEVRAGIGQGDFVREHGPGGAERAERAVDAFLRLTSRLPIVAATGGAHPRPPLAVLTRALQIVGVVGWLGNVTFVALTHVAIGGVLGLPASRDASALGVAGSVAVGILGGVVGARLHGARVATRARGRSDALELEMKARIAGFGGCSVLAFVIAFGAATLAGRI